MIFFVKISLHTIMNHKAFFKLTYGIYLVGSRKDQELSGFIANSAFQITSEPPRIAISCHKNNQTISALQHSQSFSLSVLQRDASMEMIRTFGYSQGMTGRNPSGKFNHVEVKYGKTGSPIVLSDAIAYFECRIVNSIDQGTHILFIGEVVDAVVLDDRKEPLTYAYYRDVKKAYAPPHAPTYVDQDKLNVEQPGPGSEYVCQICGYVYDPAEGDSRNGIPPGTAWEDLPDDWVCPICRASKSYFRQMD
ncbi:MAG: flavin reductase [Lentimicrobiaceae bacterium]|nr:flavin reductase [Lentimicrobiaceae bacterium]